MSLPLREVKKCILSTKLLLVKCYKLAMKSGYSQDEAKKASLVSVERHRQSGGRNFLPQLDRIQRKSCTGKNWDPDLFDELLNLPDKELEILKKDELVYADYLEDQGRSKEADEIRKELDRCDIHLKYSATTK